LQTDPHWHDLIMFRKYLHGDNGAGIGGGHQTGWTATVALMFMLKGALHSDVGLAAGVSGDRISAQTV
jgi:hypothetical protein